MSSLPAIRYSCTGFASSRRRSRFVTALRERPTAFADRVVGQAEFVDQPREAVRLLERIQILALDVLDQRQRERRLIGHRLHERRHSFESRALRRAPAALAGDDLEAAAVDRAARGSAA